MCFFLQETWGKKKLHPNDLGLGASLTSIFKCWHDVIEALEDFVNDLKSEEPPPWGNSASGP